MSHSLGEKRFKGTYSFCVDIDAVKPPTPGDTPGVFDGIYVWPHVLK